MPSTDCLWTEGSGAKTMSCRHYIAVIQHDFMTCHVVYHDGSWMMLFQELHGLPTGQHLRVCRPASSFDICWAFGRDGRRGRGGQNDVDDMQLFSFMNIFSIYIYLILKVTSTWNKMRTSKYFFKNRNSSSNKKLSKHYFILDWRYRFCWQSVSAWQLKIYKFLSFLTTYRIYRTCV